MMSQTPLYASSHMERTPHEITMSTIASRLRDIHAKMRRKEPPLPFVEDNEVVEEYVNNDAHLSVELDTRLNEISRAIIFDFQDRQNKEKLIISTLNTIIARLDEKHNHTINSTSNELPASIVALLLNELCPRLEEQFFIKQQKALEKLSSKIEQLSRDLREVTAASRHNMQISTLQNEISKIHQLLNDQNVQDKFVIEDTKDIKNNNNTPLTDENRAALSVVLKSIPVKNIEQKQQKPFNIHASARLIDAARKSR